MYHNQARRTTAPLWLVALFCSQCLNAMLQANYDPPLSASWCPRMKAGLCFVQLTTGSRIGEFLPGAALGSSCPPQILLNLLWVMATRLVNSFSPPVSYRVWEVVLSPSLSLVAVLEGSCSWSSSLQRCNRSKLPQLESWTYGLETNVSKA